MHMSYMLFFVFTMYLVTGIFANAENWETVGFPNLKFSNMLNYEKYLQPKDKDILDALNNTNYAVYIDTDSIKDAGDGGVLANQKIVFADEQPLSGTDKKLKYIVSEMTYDCAQEVIWYMRGSIYAEDGENLKYSPTVFVPVHLKNIPNNTLERYVWKFVCD